MLHLFEQHIFLAEQFVAFALKTATLSDVFDRKQNIGALRAFVEDLACVHQNDASTKKRKLEFGFVIFKHVLIGRHTLKQRSQCRNIPLTFGQRAEELALGELTLRIESEIERPAGGDHAQIAIKNQKRFADCIYDRLSERVIDLQLLHGVTAGESSLRLPETRL